MIATVAEKVNENRRDLRLTTSFAPLVKFNMAAVNRRFLLEGKFFLLIGVFQRKRRRQRQRTLRFRVQEIFQKVEFWYFAVGNAVHSGSFAVATTDRWRVVSI